MSSIFITFQSWLPNGTLLSNTWRSDFLNFFNEAGSERGTASTGSVLRSTPCRRICEVPGGPVGEKHRAQVFTGRPAHWPVRPGPASAGPRAHAPPGLSSWLHWGPGAIKAWMLPASGSTQKSQTHLFNLVANKLLLSSGFESQALSQAWAFYKYMKTFQPTLEWLIRVTIPSPLRTLHEKIYDFLKIASFKLF